MNNGENKWGVSYSSISYLEGVLENHTSVRSYTRINDIQFEIVRTRDLPDVNAVLVDEYVLGEAAVYAILEEFQGLTAVVNNGAWNTIALDWRAFAKQTGVVVLKMADFLGALNVHELSKYTTRDEREERRRTRRQSS
jgi:hypothetical protein